MFAGSKRSKARAEVDGESYTILLDNGSHDSNYINEKIAEGLDKRRYKQEMKVRVGNGSVVNVHEFVCIDININLNDELIFTNCLIFFIFPDLPFHFVIGRGDLVRLNMYPVMEKIDRAELQQEKGSQEAEKQEKEGGNEDEDVMAMMRELDEARPTIANEPRKEKIDTEFERYIANLREELNEMIDKEYADVFATKPPEIPAKVWPQRLEVIGEPVDTPEGLKKVPTELRGMGRRLPTRYIEAAREQIQELLQQGVIERSMSPISVPIQLTPKPGTNPLEMRFCLDCRKINSMVKRENFPMGGMTEFLAWMEDVQPEFFIKLDLKAMYFQLPLEEKSRILTGFNFGHEKFQFTRVVMGVANSVGHAQNVMVNQVLVGLVLTILFAYLDDILVPGSRKDPRYDIKKSLRAVFERFRQFGLYLNRSKCEIIVTETIFLGHKISRHGVEISPKKKVDFEAAPRPVTVTSLRSFLALGSYFRRFLPAFAERARGLYKLTGGPKKKVIVWTEELTTAFRDIKKMVQEAVVLKWLQREGQILLFCDASKYGFGGGIFQDQGEKETDGRVALTPIAFWGRAFEDFQVKWHTSDREMFAICFGVTTHDYLLGGRSFIVYTDHAALLSIRESASEKINRMKEKLSRYDMTIQGIAGRDNVIGDAMSRIFVEECTPPPAEDGDIEAVIEAFTNQSLNMLTESEGEYLPRMKYYHGERGHWPIKRTMELIRQDGKEWPGCEGMMMKYIEGCEACEVNEPRRQRFHGARYGLSGDAPGTSWSLDLKEVGEGYDGHKYVLVIIDNFTRRVTLFPLRGKSAEEATYFIWHHLVESGRPELVRYDPGREFNNKILQGILRFLGANAIQTAAGDHASNGIVERFIGELDGQLRRYFQGQEANSTTDWIWFLPTIAKNHNEMRHGTTGVAPNEFYGERYWNLTAEQRENLTNFVKENIIRSKRTVVDRANGEMLQPGVRVYIAVDSKEKKNLEARNWDGPFTIMRRQGDVVEVEERRGLTYHISRLKLAKE